MCALPRMHTHARGGSRSVSVISTEDDMRYVAMMFTLLVSMLAIAMPAFAQSLPGSLVSIPTSDGYQLQAYVAVPSGGGPFPLVVMPSSWSESDVEYIGEANKLARDGFI